MSDERLRGLERAWAETGAWEDRVALELGRERAGVGPGVVGELDHEDLELVAPQRPRDLGTGSALGTIPMPTLAWSGVFRPGLHRVGVYIGAEGLLVESPARGVPGNSALNRRVRQARHARENAGEPLPGEWRVWVLSLGLEEVPGGALAGAGVMKGTGVLPVGTVRVTDSAAGHWIVRVDGDVPVRGSVWVVGVTGLVPRDGIPTRTIGTLRRERIDSAGRAPVGAELNGHGVPTGLDVRVPAEAPVPTTWDGLRGHIRETGRRISAASGIPRRLLYQGPGQSALRGDPDTASEPGVGE